MYTIRNGQQHFEKRDCQPQVRHFKVRRIYGSRSHLFRFDWWIGGEYQNIWWKRDLLMIIEKSVKCGENFPPPAGNRLSFSEELGPSKSQIREAIVAARFLKQHLCRCLDQNCPPQSV